MSINGFCENRDIDVLLLISKVSSSKSSIGVDFFLKRNIIPRMINEDAIVPAMTPSPILSPVEILYALSESISITIWLFCKRVFESEKLFDFEKSFVDENMFEGLKVFVILKWLDLEKWSVFVKYIEFVKKEDASKPSDLVKATEFEKKLVFEKQKVFSNSFEPEKKLDLVK